MKWGHAVLVTVAMGASSTLARAQANASRADALFDEGTKLLDQKRYAEACPKLEESRKLGTGIGVDLYLADCYEGLGHPARSLPLLREAEILAVAKRDPRATIAHDKVRALEARLPTVVLEIAAPDKEATISLDGQTLPADQWAKPITVDPGSHSVVVVAKDGSRSELAVTAPAASQSVTVRIPEPSRGSATSTSTAATSSFWSPVRIGGAVTAGVGLALLGIGVGFGVDAIAKRDASASDCNASDQCNAAGLALRDQGLSSATISTALVVIGGVATAAGVVLVAVGKPRAGAAVGFSVGPARAGVTIRF